MILAPRSWPSRPGLATRTRMGGDGIGESILAQVQASEMVVLSLGRKGVPDARGDHVDRGVVYHLAKLRVRLRFLNLEVLADGAQQLQGFGDLLLREQIDLEVELVADVDALLHPVLFHQDEGAKQDAFDGHNHGEQDEGVGIEPRDAGDNACVDEKPGQEPYQVQKDEGHGAGEAADQIGDPVYEGATVLQGGFHFGDRGDVVAHGAGYVWVSLVHALSDAGDAGTA